MTTTDASPVLHVPARDIPIPRHLSREAQAVLAMDQLEQRELPALDDLDAWRALIAARHEAVLAMIAERTSYEAVDVAEIDLDGAIVYEITPKGIADDDRRVVLELHGGGFITGGGECCRALAVKSAAEHRGTPVGRRLPDATRSPVPDTARRLCRGLPRTVA